jgi:hypothetical protein
VLKKGCFLFLGIIFACIASQSYIRYPAFSGQFYPASAMELRNIVDAFFVKVTQNSKPQASKVLGMIVPHAGYQFSGQTAAYAYNILKNHKFNTIVIIGPFHADHFKGVSIWNQGSWQTPLGSINVDEELA